ncbi:MAG: glycosyltransferase family 1 protein, partial [Chitinophagaceae bacterium]
RHNRVLYVNRPLDRITQWKAPKDKKTINRLKSIKKGENVLDEVEKDLFVFNPQTKLESINWLPHGKVYTLLNKQNNRRLARQIQKASDQLRFKDPVLFIDNDFYNGLYLQDYLNVEYTIYYLRDYLLAQPYFNRHGKFSEPELISKVDLVVTNSLYLTKYAKKYNTRSYYTGQGTGDEFFVNEPAVFPPDISRIKKPVIGYCGFLTEMRLDIKLLEKIAAHSADWNLVLIGPEDEAFKNSALHQMSNVHFLGNKPEKELPSYVHYFDVCLNPQLVNQLTVGNYPRKVDEYLATGKPVVATRTETMEAFADCTYLCDSHDDYISFISRILEDGDDQAAKERRIAIARSHTWENSVALMYEAMHQFKTL